MTTKTAELVSRLLLELNTVRGQINDLSRREKTVQEQLVEVIKRNVVEFDPDVWQLVVDRLLVVVQNGEIECVPVEIVGVGYENDDEFEGDSCALPSSGGK